MILKSIVIFGVIIAAQAASLQQRNIPVKVVYEQLNPKSIDSEKNLDAKLQLSSEQVLKVEVPQKPVIILEEVPLLSAALHSRKNLDEKVQLSPEQLLESKLKLEVPHTHEEIPAVQQTIEAVNSIKNLDEKTQLSPEELAQSIKHLAVQSEVEQPEKIQEPTTSFAKLGETPKHPVTEKPFNALSLIHEAQEIVASNLKRLRNNLKNHEVTPDLEAWKNLDKSVDSLFQLEKDRLDLKQSNNQNILQSISSGIQNITNNFVQNFQGQAGSNNTNQGDEQQPSGGGFQSFVNNFQGTVQNIVSTINNIGNQGATTTSTVLGDSGVGTTQSSNIFSNIVNNVQQFLGGNQGNQAINATQGDTGINNTGPQGFFQGAINQFNQVVSNIVPSTQAPPQGDEGTVTPSNTNNPVQVIQSFGSQIGNAFNQFIQGPSTKPPGTSGDEGVAAPAPAQGGPLGIFQGVSNQISNTFNQITGQTTAKPAGASGDTGVTSAPQGGQNFIQNVGVAIQNLNPFRPTTGKPAAPVEGTTVGAPVEAGTDTKKPDEDAVKPVKEDDVKKGETVQPVKVEDPKKDVTVKPVQEENKKKDETNEIKKEKTIVESKNKDEIMTASE